MCKNGEAGGGREGVAEGAAPRSGPRGLRGLCPGQDTSNPVIPGSRDSQPRAGCPRPFPDAAGPHGSSRSRPQLGSRPSPLGIATDAPSAGKRWPCPQRQARPAGNACGPRPTAAGAAGNGLGTARPERKTWRAGSGQQRGLRLARCAKGRQGQGYPRWEGSGSRGGGGLSPRAEECLPTAHREQLPPHLATVAVTPSAVMAVSTCSTARTSSS